MQGESTCAAYTLIQETIPPSHLRLLRSDCPCSRQRATPPTESTSKHVSTPKSSLLPTSGIQKQPAVQTALLNTTTNHSDSSAYSGVTANAVINEQLSGPSAKSSNPPEFWRCKRSLPLQTATRTPASRFEEKNPPSQNYLRATPRSRYRRVCRGRLQTEARQG